MSESLGKGTIAKKTTGQTRGRQGSSSKNFDVLGRELMTPDEARKLNNKQCLILIRGFDPIIDKKYRPFGHPAFPQTADGKGEVYVHEPSKKKGEEVELLTPDGMAYYEKRKGRGANISIDKLTYEEFKLLEAVANHDTAKQTNQALKGKDSITNRMVTWSYSKEQKDVLREALKANMPNEDILSFFYPGIPAEEMKHVYETFIAQQNQTKGGTKHEKKNERCN